MATRKYGPSRGVDVDTARRLPFGRQRKAGYVLNLEPTEAVLVSRIHNGIAASSWFTKNAVTE
ncbi:hypothetical protein HGP16_28340 [Rhizobium sp. P40RR-XXII]|uniref:hypothetical protein n=1 Tax=Rhizobium sp. P40RR-XXII TaxID=2726739 RepID=UPI00145714B5|nr:hypothetical protein [Rhizobium sp. P40RR-XXII]NLS20441.1 hypothetical protein [Rhizobium sp. P40RR-XXII]